MNPKKKTTKESPWKSSSAAYQCTYLWREKYREENIVTTKPLTRILKSFYAKQHFCFFDLLFFSSWISIERKKSSCDINASESSFFLLVIFLSFYLFSVHSFISLAFSNLLIFCVYTFERLIERENEVGEVRTEAEECILYTAVLRTNNYQSYWISM